MKNFFIIIDKKDNIHIYKSEKLRIKSRNIILTKIILLFIMSKLNYRILIRKKYK